MYPDQEATIFGYSMRLFLRTPLYEPVEGSFPRWANSLMEGRRMTLVWRCIPDGFRFHEANYPR